MGHRRLPNPPASHGKPRRASLTASGRDAGVDKDKEQKDHTPLRHSLSQLDPKLRLGAARGTRSANQEIVTAFEWEALDIAKQSGGRGSSSSSKNTRPAVVKCSPAKVTLPVHVKRPPHVEPESHENPKEETDPPARRLSLTMSRNRARAPPAHRDNGVAATEETEIWTRIVGDLKMAQEKNDQQKVLAEQIRHLNEKIGKEGGSESTSTGA